MKQKIVKKLTKLKPNRPILVCLVIWYTAFWSWILFTDTLDLAGNKTQGLLLAIGIMAIIVALSAAIMWQAVRLCNSLLKKWGNWSALAIVPLLAFADFVVAWIPAALWIGPQGRIDSLLPLASPALLVINAPLGFAGRMLGFFGLAGFFWGIAFFAIKKKWSVVIIITVVLTVTSGISWIAYKNPDGAPFKAVVISERLDQRVGVVNAQNEELVIFPEYGLDEVTKDKLGERITSSSPEDKAYFIGSSQEQTKHGEVGHLNTLLYGNTKDGFTQEQDKYRLIPGGEDLAFVMRLFLRATNQKSTLDYFSYAKGVISGDEQLKPLKIGQDIVIGAAVCSSIIAPHDYRAFTNSGATVLTNSASLSIFKGSRLFSWQQKSFARFMAISNSRYFLQSANAARAYMLDNNGNTIAESYDVEALKVTPVNNTKKTPYTNLGEWLAIIGGLVVVGLGIDYIVKNKLPARSKPKKK